MAWLLDTNILSEGRRPRPEPKIAAFMTAQPLDELYISVVNLAEFRFGIELLEDPARRAELNDWLVQKEGRKVGHTFSQPDLLIAATALHHGLTVVTRDRSDYDKARVPVLNPWET
jgi:predicted nucleic acid-binding protein